MAEIYFTNEDILLKISEILNKNGVDEDIIEAALKVEPSFIGSTFKLTKDLAGQKISEETFVSELQKQLNISEQAAKNITDVVKKEILPYAEKIEIKPEEKNPSSFVKEKPTMSVEENEKIINKTKKIFAPTKKISKSGKKSQAEQIEEELPEEKQIQPQRVMPSGPDKYRESI